MKGKIHGIWGKRADSELPYNFLQPKLLHKLPTIEFCCASPTPFVGFAIARGSEMTTALGKRQ
jgi:hypothetical protein